MSAREDLEISAIIVCPIAIALYIVIGASWDLFNHVGAGAVVFVWWHPRIAIVVAALAWSAMLYVLAEDA